MEFGHGLSREKVQGRLCLDSWWPYPNQTCWVRLLTWTNITKFKQKKIETTKPSKFETDRLFMKMNYWFIGLNTLPITSSGILENDEKLLLIEKGLCPNFDL